MKFITPYLYEEVDRTVPDDIISFNRIVLNLWTANYPADVGWLALPEFGGN